MVANRVLAASDISSSFGELSDLAPLGEPGGSGECWKAKSASHGDVALKILVHPHEPRRFQREIDGLKRVTSPNVMQLHEAGLKNCGGTDRPYILSELINGPNLREALAAQGPAPEAMARKLLTGLLSGASALAGADVVHRDLKPENIVLRDGRFDDPVIIDLGLCRLGSNSSLTQYPWYGGTVPYSSPEQIRLEPALDRSDVWAIGIIVAEALMGKHPYLAAHTFLPPDYLDILKKEVPLPHIEDGLMALLRSMTEYAAYKRPAAAKAAAQIGGTTA